MRFWDTSALAPLLIRERNSSALEALSKTDPAIVAWWGTLPECTSAIARLERQGRLSQSETVNAFSHLQDLAERWHEIQPSETLRQSALRFLRVHPLRAADALQLAAAFAAAEGKPRNLPFVCLDERLSAAAGREGFPLMPRPE